MPESHAGLAAFRYPNFTLFTVARFFVVAALEMQSVALGWQIYEITRRPFDLGLVGLAQFLPVVFLFLTAGHAADRVNRKTLVAICYVGFGVCYALLFEIARMRMHAVGFIYTVLILLGMVQAFNAPAARSLLPLLVPIDVFPSAVAWNATIFQGATILGPALGGLLYAVFRGPADVYGIALIVAVLALIALLRLELTEPERPHEEVSMRSVLAGLHYIWTHKIILGSISLDLFAVLLGGSVALLPVYARDILHTGAWGLGLLRAAPGV